MPKDCSPDTLRVPEVQEWYILIYLMYNAHQLETTGGMSELMATMGFLDMHLELRWGVGHVALLIFVFQLYIKLNRR